MKGLLFTYALTYGGAVVSIFNPFYGLLIYVCFAIIKPETTWHFSVPVGNYSRIVAVAMLIGWALHGFGNWRFGRGRLSVVFFGLFVTGAIVSGLFASHPDVAWVFIENKLKIFLPFLVGMTIVDSWQKVWQLTWVIILSQGFLAINENQTYFEGAFRSGENQTAHLMMVGAAFTGIAALHLKAVWQRALCAILALLMVHAVMFHMSRGAMIGVGIAGLVAFVVVRKRTVHYAAFLVAMLLVLRLAGPQVREEALSVTASGDDLDVSAQSRFDLWRDMWDATANSPLVGIGPDHWRRISYTYGWPKGKDGHGLWIQMPCELGIPAGSCLLLLYFSTVVLLWPVARRKFNHDPHGSVALAQMVLSALAGFIVEAMFGSLSGVELPYYVALIGGITLKLSSADTLMSGAEDGQVGPSQSSAPPELLAP
jgi:O-antigen ligase